MKKLLTISLLMFTYAAKAQEPSADVKKITDDKSFVFIATASFGGKPEGNSYWQNVYPSSPEGTLIKDASINTFLNAVSWPDLKTKAGADRMTKNSTDKFPVVYIQEENALFHPSVFKPAYDKLRGLNPDSLNKPLAIENYTIRTNKRGKVFISFKINDSNFDQAVKLAISPDGKAEMSIATSVINRNRYPRFYKGYIQDLASL
jgi:hypothetical protein